MSSQANRGGGVIAAMANHVSANKIDAFLWLTRMSTIFFTAVYLLTLLSSIFGMNPYGCYYRALLSNAATSALRLHQRLPRVTLSRHFLALLLVEDSFHYLAYSLIFLFCYPTTFVLFPIFFFALLHASRYLSILLSKAASVGGAGGLLTRSSMVLHNFVEEQQRHILMLVAFMEILMMSFIVMMTLQGKCSLMTPIFYYHFLNSRYASHRNPYTRKVFYSLRLRVEGFASNPHCPALVRRAIFTLVGVISRLAPIVPQA